MINREIPFRPRLEGEFRVRFYNAASEITEKTPTLTIARIAEREIEWVEKDCQYNIEQRKKYRAVWFLFRDLIRASWKACYRNGVIYMSLPTLNGTDLLSLALCGIWQRNAQVPAQQTTQQDWYLVKQCTICWH